MWNLKNKINEQKTRNTLIDTEIRLMLVRGEGDCGLEGDYGQGPGSTRNPGGGITL